MHSKTTRFLFRSIEESLTILVEFFLVSGTDITEPFPVWLDSSNVGISGGLMPLTFIGFIVIHVDTLDGSTGTEL